MGQFIIGFPDSFNTFETSSQAVTACKMVQHAHPRDMTVYLITKVLDLPVAPIVGEPPPKRFA